MSVKQEANIISYKSAKTDGQEDNQIQHYEMTETWSRLLQSESLVFLQKQLIFKRLIRHFKVSAAHLDSKLRIICLDELPFSSCFQHVLPKQRGFCLRFYFLNWKCEILLVSLFTDAVVSIPMGKLAFQGLCDESCSICRIAGLQFGFTFHWTTFD